MATYYGKDISATNGIKTGRYSRGVRLVAEAAYRRLITPAGSLHGGEEEQNYGFDLTSLVGSAKTKSDAAALPGRIQAELRKDERIESVDVVVTVTTATNGAVAWVVRIDGKTAEGPFSFQVGIDDVSIELLGISG